jgi:hypothetical protein
MATAGVTLGTDVLKVGLALLAQHTARLKDAKDENNAVNQIIPAFDADVTQIAAAYNTGTHSLDECVAAVEAVDAQILAYLQTQVGKPGTAWDGSGKCGKQCTVGCCVYYNNLHSALYGPQGQPYNGNLAAANGANGFIPVMLAGGGVVVIPKVYSSKYGLQARSGYTITLKQAPLVEGALDSLESALATLTGSNAGGFPGSGVGGASISTTTLVVGALLVFAAIFVAVKLGSG